MRLLLAEQPGVLREKFFDLQTPQDVAALLEVDYRKLNYYLYILPESQRYSSFYIPKTNGEQRLIIAPCSGIKILQQKLNQIFQLIYMRKPSVHGFVNGYSVVSNAENHVGKRYVFNIDLKNFSPSIHFGRVRGLFISKPYNLNPKVATVLAQICCYNNQLPQGAPTSPIVSNMICARMDGQLQKLAKKHGCFYTRYADDSVPRTKLSAS